jgi:hypothetical protein
MVRNPGIVDEEIETFGAPFFQNSAYLGLEACEGGAVAGIETERRGTPARLPNRRDDLVGRSPVRVVRENRVDAAPGKRLHRGAAKAAATAGDERDWEICGHGSPPLIAGPDLQLAILQN